jgi:hypothetical protein
VWPVACERLCGLDEHADAARVEECHAREIDDDVASDRLQRSIELRCGRHVDLATDDDDAGITSVRTSMSSCWAMRRPFYSPMQPFLRR